MCYIFSRNKELSKAALNISLPDIFSEIMGIPRTGEGGVDPKVIVLITWVVLIARFDIETLRLTCMNGKA